MPYLVLPNEVYAVVGSAITVYNTLGCGFLEAVYQEALSLEFARRHVPFVQQQELRISYFGTTLRKTYIADFIVFDRVIVELKAVDALSKRDEAQLLNYLKATSIEVGVLLNFGSLQRLEWKRMVYSSQ